jgi:hypothetical protein
MAKKLKVPKKIAGVKVPKQLRGKSQSAGQRELAAAALIAVAGALLTNKKVRAALADVGDKAAKQGQKAATKARAAAKDATRHALEAAEATTKRLAAKLAADTVDGVATSPRRRNAGALSAEKH